VVIASPTKWLSLEAFLENPPERFEWVNEKLVEKPEMTAKTGRIQARLAYYWRSHMISSGQSGEVYTETACRTIGRVRCPDVAYLPPELVHQFGDFKVLPHSFSLIAEIISPTDEAEEVFTKVREYLESNAQEIWLIFPESRWLMVITSDFQQLFSETATVATKQVLHGFSISVGELIA
jgi:Uma2 family endonuclease